MKNDVYPIRRADTNPKKNPTLGRRIIESIPFGTKPVRTAVQTGHCLNKCSGSVTSERLIKLDVVYTAVQKRDCLNSCLYSHSSEKP